MILAHDLATCTGWAAGDGTKLPEVGHVRLPEVINGARGPKFSTYRTFLRRQFEAWAPTTFIFEAPILPRPFMSKGRLVMPTNIETTTVLQGLAAIAELEAHDAGIRCVQTDVQTVKLQLAGNGRADKNEMVRAARKAGLTIKVDDEADAFGVWLVGVRYYAPRELHRFDRMLWGRAAGGPSA